ncbi:MAG: HDOD domain-containing protein, partial [Panacagrimonas sp.]
VGELYLLKVAENLLLEDPQSDTLTPALLDEVLEAMHNQVGHDVMRKWDLPEAYARVARDHHAVEFKSDDILMIMCRLMDQACRKLGLAGPADPDVQLAANFEAQLLGLTDVKAAQLEIFLEDAIAGAAEFR